MTARKLIFIDGEAGTTGLGIRLRLEARSDVEIVSIDPELRKDPEAKKAILKNVDLTVLCLPDEAAREAVSLIDRMGASAPRILDASSAHRIGIDWTYGFPELAKDQPDIIAAAKRVSNPGCYASGAVALLRPLADAGLLANDPPITINGVSGYSGGGKSMIAAYDSGNAPAFELYALGLNHKHLPEITMHGGLRKMPIFMPSVGNFAQGMLVSVPLELETLPGAPEASHLEQLLKDHYKGRAQVRVVPPELSGRLDPTGLNHTDLMELQVFAHPKYKQAVLVARLDNLGKGASGAAVQNIRLMLGLG